MWVEVILVITAHTDVPMLYERKPETSQLGSIQDKMQTKHSVRRDSFKPDFFTLSP